MTYSSQVFNMMTIFLSFVIAFAGGVFYRMGGSGRYPRFWRDLGQGICFALEMLILGLMAWAWQPFLGVFLGFGVCWAESTYFKAAGKDADWLSWALVGAVFGLVALPYCVLVPGHWLGFAIRLPLCVGLTVLWQEVLSNLVALHLSAILKLFNKPAIGKDVTDEVGRGFINIITLPLLLV
jgi:hypothetical protein